MENGNRIYPKDFARMLNIPWRSFLVMLKGGVFPERLTDENGRKHFTSAHLESCRRNGLSREGTCIRAFETEVDMTDAQRRLFVKSLGILRFMYNLFIDVNRELHLLTKDGPKPAYMNDTEFSKWFNNVYLRFNPGKAWVKECSSKVIKQVLLNAHKAYMEYLGNVAAYRKDPKGKEFPKPPRFKKKFVNEPSFYFIKDSVKVERHRIKIPIFKWLRLKEFGYIPENADVVSGNLTVKSGRVFLSLRCVLPKPEPVETSGEGIGIDLGVKDLATVSTGRVFENINRTATVRRLEKKLERLDRSIARKRKAARKAGTKTGEKRKISERLRKAYARRRKLFFRLACIRNAHIGRCVAELVRSKPKYVTIEDLNVSGMMRNRHLAKALAAQKLSAFRSLLVRKLQEAGIEVRIVDRWYPSSKTCHSCGEVKKDLKLKDRVFLCPHCGHRMDRDLNAALNLRDAEDYRLAA